MNLFLREGREKVISAEIHFSSGKYLWKYALVRPGKKYRIPDPLIETDDSEQFFSCCISENSPVILGMHGNGILHYQLPASAENPFESALPSANEDDFYVQKIHADNNEIILSIVRKDRMEPLLLEFRNRRIPVLGITLGSFAVQCLLPHVLDSFFEEDFAFADGRGLSYVFEKGFLRSFSVLPESQEPTSDLIRKISEYFRINNNMLILFANAMQYSENNFKVIELPVPSVQVSRSVYQDKRLFYYYSKNILLILLLLFVIQQTFYWYFIRENRSLMREIGRKRNQTVLLRGQTDEIREKREILIYNRKRKVSFSFIADRIACCVPQEVRLERMDFFPDKNEPQYRNFRFENFPDIVICGTAQETKHITRFPESLSVEKWIKNVSINGMEFNHEKSEYIFTLIVSLKKEMDEKI